MAGADAAALRQDARFAAHLQKYGKSYSPEEMKHRGAIFARNMADIEAHNAAGHTWRKGENKWTDLTGDEWRAVVGSGRKPRLGEKKYDAQVGLAGGRRVVHAGGPNSAWTISFRSSSTSTKELSPRF